MNWVLIFLLFFTCFGFTLAATCPVGTIASLTDSTKCYLFNTQKQSFLLAEKTCVNNGGHLTSVHSIFENEYIKEEARANLTGDSLDDSIWIGLQDLQTAGTWKWLDRSGLSFNDWGKGEPQKITGADCGALKLQGGMWAAEDCDNKMSSVCLIRISGPTSTTTTTMTATTPTSTTTKPHEICPEGWILYEKTKSCYFVGVNKTWTDAEAWCYSSGGGAHLVSIHSSDENIFVTDIIPSVPQKCNNENFASIGLSYIRQGDNYNWTWSDNSLLNFTLWAPGKPLNPNLYSCTTLRNDP